MQQAKEKRTLTLSAVIARYLDFCCCRAQHKNVSTPSARSAVRLIVEILILIPGSLLVGFAIGTVQHIVAFGVWGYGFGSDVISLAAFEGGIVGAALGLITGLITYYVVLRRDVDSRTVTYTIGGALVGGCVLGVVFFWLSAFATPILTVALAFWLHKNRSRSQPVAG